MYVIEYGDVWMKNEGVSQLIHVCSGSEQLAIAYDAENGTMHKRGSYKTVSKWLDKTTKALRAGGFDELVAHLVIAAMPVSQAAVDLLNRCNDNSSTVSALIAAGELPGVTEKLVELGA